MSPASPVTPLAAPARAPSAPARPAYPLLVLRLRGSQAEMGQQHGELLRGHGGHEEVLRYYPRMPAVMMGPAHGGPPAALARPVIGLLLRRLDRDRPRDLRERSRAFFAALGLPASYSRHLFVMDLLQNVVGTAGRLAGLGPSRRLMAGCAVPACSSVAVWGAASQGGALRHARNFDFPGAGVWERWPAVVFCQPDGGQRYGFVTTRGADAPGVTGFNEAGLTVTAHTRFHRDVRWSGAGVIDLTHDLVRRAETLADALKIARERPAQSTWGIIVSSARERSASVLEVTSRAVEAVRPRPGEDFLLQTNRYATPALARDEVAPCVGHLANSDGRARVIRARVERGLDQGGLGVDDLQALLGAHDDPEVEGAARAAGGVLAQGISVKSVVVEPDARRVHLSVGPCPTGAGPWTTVDWDWDGPPAAREVEADLEHRAPHPRFAEGARRDGHERYVAAVSLDGQGAPTARIAAAMEEAVALDPDEPGYRLIAAGFRLRHGDPAGALEHLRAGLARERAPFHRGQLLLWAARAADALGRTDEAREHRASLRRLESPHLVDHHATVEVDARRPWTTRRLRRVVVNMVFPDLVV
ncbi:MAG: C45 family peptidase [Planctomycetes bacterium]|nr:C45 family peptidase [Planctomycetota bacterium]